MNISEAMVVLGGHPLSKFTWGPNVVDIINHYIDDPQKQITVNAGYMDIVAALHEIAEEHRGSVGQTTVQSPPDASQPPTDASEGDSGTTGEDPHTVGSAATARRFLNPAGYFPQFVLFVAAGLMMVALVITYHHRHVSPDGVKNRTAMVTMIQKVADTIEEVITGKAPDHTAPGDPTGPASSGTVLPPIPTTP